jgi:DNA-binding LytR/AlgR family response regulator
MLRIAICDDNISDLSNMISIVNDYIVTQGNKLEIEYVAYQNAADLIAAMENGQRYDVLLLDILMPLVNGMDAAKEIRQYNQDVKIIFSTSSPEFAVESYSVGAFYYAIKPIWKEKLFLLLDKVIAEIKVAEGASFLIKSKAGLTRIYINRLEYAEVIGRTIVYHIIDGSVVEAAGSMAELNDMLLKYPNFIRPHRSYIINMEFIDTLSNKEIIMKSHSTIPMARANYQTVKSAYISYAFSVHIVHDDL